MTQAQVVQLMRSLPQGAVTLQVSRQETRPSNNEDDAVSVLEVVNGYNHVIHSHFHGNRCRQAITAMKQL